MITLSSDFGSPYPGAMKGVICQWTETKLVDVTHDLPRQDVRSSAFWLRETLPYFPPAVHLAVIDPGVGTDRDAIVVRAGEHALVGPDNGVLIPVARQFDPDFDVFRIETEPGETTGTDRTHWPPRLASATFHGRDVFAPAAAHVHESDLDSLDTDEGLTPTESYESFSFPEPELSATGAVGEIIAIDDFGNAITNVPGTHLDDTAREILVDGETVPYCHSYAEVDPGTALVTVASHGNVELAVNQGRGDRAFEVDLGERIRLSW